MKKLTWENAGKLLIAAYFIVLAGCFLVVPFDVLLSAQLVFCVLFVGFFGFMLYVCGYFTRELIREILES